MISLLKRLFVQNWPRKVVAAILAVVLWFTVNQSLSTTRTVTNVPVRVINIPAGKTIVDLQSSGLLTKRVSLTLDGDKRLLDTLSPSDLEVVIDAQGKKGEWIASINRRNLVSTNPNVDLNKGVSRVSPTSVIIRLTKLVSEKIPVFVTQPIGQAPKGYQFLDVWPYQLSLTISGPEDVMKRLKAKGIRLTFDLSDITKAELDALRARPEAGRGDEVSYYIPDPWKRVNIPLLSETPITIDDPRANHLRIDFVRISNIPIKTKVPLALYFPTETLKTYNPKTISWGKSPLIELDRGLSVLSEPVYAKGVTPLFVQVVEQMMQISITVDPTNEKKTLPWSIEFINPRLLEDRYVSLMMSDSSDKEIHELQPLVREEYLRNRFRSYMNRFVLYKGDDSRLELQPRLENSKVLLTEGPIPLSTTPKIENK